jgi:hypothetical protein
MIQYAAAAQAVSCFAVFISTSLHMLPKCDHLITKPSSAPSASCAFAGVAKKQESLLLLLYHLSFLSCS